MHTSSSIFIFANDRISSAMVLLGCSVFSCVSRRSSLHDDDGPELGRTISTVAAQPDPDADAVRRFSWSEIESATAGFTSPVIGHGGFSSVYLAQLRSPPSSRRAAAAKVLCCGERMHRAFRQELDVLRSARHPHIVRLLGFCDDREEGVLVFEYASSGDLHGKLHGGGDEYSGETLSWSRRMLIAFQVATALEYLHDRCDPAVVHGDIKASNVLLDDNLDAKLCDFGVSSVGFSSAVRPRGWHPVIVGSPGYVDPNFLRSGIATKKTDVYSFGVLLLELITGADALGAKAASPGRPLKAGDAADLVDRRLRGQFDDGEAAAVASLAARCLTESPGMRPAMAEVVSVLKVNACRSISTAGCRSDDKGYSCSY